VCDPSGDVFDLARPDVGIEAGDSIRRELGAVDRRVAVGTVFALERALRSAYAQPRFTMIILTAFAGTGLLLVAAGVYGVMAYAVSRRTQEIAVRMALGADRRHVLGAVVRSGAQLLAIGIAVGLMASLGTNGLLADQLWQVSAHDPVTMTAAAGLVLVAGLVAGYVPARRAAGLDPMVALRHESRLRHPHGSKGGSPLAATPGDPHDLLANLLLFSRRLYSDGSRLEAGSARPFMTCAGGYGA
jgi:hypothetical protein